MIRSNRVTPVVMVDRQTVLNGDLSPTARLVYVLLLAGLEDLHLEQVAVLAGLETVDDVRPYIAELEAVGAADLKDHTGRGEVVTVHEGPLVPGQRIHTCVPCQDCGGCSCEYMKGLCQDCYRIRSVRTEAREDIARWQAEVDAGHIYAYSSNITRLHRWDCKTLNTVDRGQQYLEEQLEAARTGKGEGYVYWPRLPKLYTAEQLRLKGIKKKNCAICGPDPL